MLRQAAMLFCILCLICLVAVAGERGQGKGEAAGKARKEGEMRGGLAAKIMALDLTDEQKQKVKELLKKHREKMKSVTSPEEKKEAMHSLKAQLQGILSPAQMEELRAQRGEKRRKGHGGNDE